MSLSFLITKHYYSKQYGLSVGGKLIFGHGAALNTPFGWCPFIWFVFCHVLVMSPEELIELRHIAGGSQSCSSEQLNKIFTVNTLKTKTKPSSSVLRFTKKQEDRGAWVRKSNWLSQFHLALHPSPLQYGTLVNLFDELHASICMNLGRKQVSFVYKSPNLRTQTLTKQNYSC